MVVQMLKKYWGYEPGAVVNVSPINARRFIEDGIAKLYVKPPEMKQTKAAPKDKMTTGAKKTK